MENASKALLIAGAILLAILIIAIGMFIYNSASANINDSLTNMSTQEKEAFNAQFTSYEQTQTGSNVKALIGRLIANANTYTDESAKVPKVTYKPSNNQSDPLKGTASANISNIGTTDGNISTYVQKLGNIRNGIVNKHEYWVTFTFGTSGLISGVEIKYDK